MNALTSEIRSPKSEIRNKLECSNAVDGPDLLPAGSVSSFSGSVIRIGFGFRISEFGFRIQRILTATAVLMLVSGVFTGCGTTDGGSASVSGSVYYGAALYDPWYYGGDYPPDVIVTPPSPGSPPVKPEHPIVTPPAPAPAPRPLPSIPAMPMPRPAMRR